jgi:hypothetical protein
MCSTHYSPPEHKSERFRIWSFQRPHHMAFQFSWLAFFAAFVSTFAPAALLPVIRDNLDLVRRLGRTRGPLSSHRPLGTPPGVTHPHFSETACDGQLALMRASYQLCFARQPRPQPWHRLLRAGNGGCRRSHTCRHAPSSTGLRPNSPLSYSPSHLLHNRPSLNPPTDEGGPG